MTRRALVTGGAGFIGGHLVERLVADGWSVRVLDDFSSGRDANLEAVAGEVEVLRGDIRDAGTVARAVQGAEVVFHQAAIPSVPRSVAEPRETDAVNVHGTLAVLDAARSAGVRRLVFAASCAAYGDDPELPKREGMALRPASPYALQKLTGEHYCRLYTELFGLETVALRYFNVYGPRQNPDGDYAAAIPLFVRAFLKGDAPNVYGDGEQTRDFVFVGDVVRANLLAADARDAAGAVVNVASGRRTSVNDIVRAIRETTGSSVAACHREERPGDVRHSVADLARARELLAYEPRVDLREGLRRSVESFRAADGGGGTA